jgi:isoleucyl-tRNA synthetase
VIQSSGADLLRLWTVNMDYSEDVKIGDDILKRQSDIYRRFRNTLRYLLGALYDFKKENSVDFAELPELEKYILHQLFQLRQKHKKALNDFELASFYADLQVFCSNELSAFYLDIRKDSLYCDERDSLKRRAAQTVMDTLFVYISHWLAPVLCFTAEEAWQYYKFNQEESIHEQLFPEAPPYWNQPHMDKKWKKIKQMRRVITTAIEQERLAKSITSGLQTRVDLFVPADCAAILETIDMAEIAILSQFSFTKSPPQAGAVVLAETPEIGAIVVPAKGEKCPRCWKISSHPQAMGLCQRCFALVNT